MLPVPRFLLPIGVFLFLFASLAHAGMTANDVVTTAEGRIVAAMSINNILEAAKTLFWSLAVISLVWTMGMLVLRQDIGEVLMELLRFLIVTGIFYWLLVNASEEGNGDGFIGDIIESFFQLADGVGGSRFRVQADGFVARGLHTYFSALDATKDGTEADQILAGGIGVIVLVLMTLIGAQFLVTLVTAWLLGYAGIFLLGFGGARWTSPLAINYYKHALAVGMTVLVLSLIGAGGHRVLQDLTDANLRASSSQFTLLGMTLAVSVLLMVLAVRIPQLFYTIVTGSHLGFFAGAAGMIGSAIATGGGSALAAASGRASGSGGGGSLPGGSPGGSTARTESVMDAVHRSAVASGGMGDPFHVGSGSDPFGVPRRQDAARSGGSVFGGGSTVSGTTAVPAVPAASNVPPADDRRAAPKAAAAGDAATGDGSRDALRADGRAAGEPPDYAAELNAIHRARDMGHASTGADASGPMHADRTPGNARSVTSMQAGGVIDNPVDDQRDLRTALDGGAVPMEFGGTDVHSNPHDAGIGDNHGPLPSTWPDGTPADAVRVDPQRGGALSAASAAAAAPTDIMPIPDASTPAVRAESAPSRRHPDVVSASRASLPADDHAPSMHRDAAHASAAHRATSTSEPTPAVASPSTQGASPAPDMQAAQIVRKPPLPRPDVVVAPSDVTSHHPDMAVPAPVDTGSDTTDTTDSP